MKTFWTVFRFELLLYWRGWTGWLVALVIALVGAGISTLVNRVNNSWWSNLCMFLGLMTLLLALTTGNQIQRDGERRLDGIILSTPLATVTYVLGKYLAGLFSLLGYALVAWIALVATSDMLNGVLFFTPPLGPGIYLQIWLLLVLVPVLFAASLMLLGLTLTRGQRAFISIMAVIIWIVPFIIVVPKVLTVSFYLPHDLLFDGNRFLGDSDFVDSAVRYAVPFAPLTDAQVTSEIGQHMTHLYQTVVISEHMTTNLLINRAFFLVLSMLLIISTIFVVHRQRQGRL